MAPAQSLPPPAYQTLNMLTDHCSDDDNYPHAFAESFTCCWRLPLKDDSRGAASSALCGCTFDSADLLFTHLSDIHVGRKTRGNLCLTCHWENCVGVTVTKRDHLTSHLRTHVRFKPHVCDSCGRAFKRPQDLKKHERIHADRTNKTDGPSDPTQIQFIVHSSNGHQLNISNPSAPPAPATTSPAYLYARSETTPPLSDGSSSRHYSPVAHSVHSPRDGISNGTPSETVRNPSPLEVSWDGASGVNSVEGLLPAGSAVDLDLAARGLFTHFVDGGVPQYNHVMQTELDTFGDVLNHSGTPSAFTIPPYDITQMESWLNQLHQNIQDEFYHDHSLQHGSSPPRLGESGSSSVSVLHHQMSQASTYGVMPPFSLTPDLSSSLTDRGITSSPASATSLPRGERNGLSYPHDPNDPSSFFAILPPPPTTIAGIPATIAPSLLTSNAIYFDPATSATVQSPEHLKEQERKLKQQEAELAQQQALLRQQQEQLRQQQLQLQQQLYSTTAASVSSTAGIGLAEETPRVVPRYNIPERVVYTMVRQRAAYDEDESSESDHERSVVDGAPPPPPRRRLTSSSVASTAISTSGAFGENLSRTATGSLSIGSLRPRVDVTPSVPPRRNPPKAGTQAPPPPARETSAQVTSTADSSLPPAVPPRKKPPASKTNSMISAVTTIIEDESKARDGAEDISTMMEKKLNISELKGELERESSDVERVQRRKRLEKHLRIVSFLMEKVRAIRAVKKQGDSGEGKERDGAVGRMVAAC